MKRSLIYEDNLKLKTSSKYQPLERNHKFKIERRTWKHSISLINGDWYCSIIMQLIVTRYIDSHSKRGDITQKLKNCLWHSLNTWIPPQCSALLFDQIVRIGLSYYLAVLDHFFFINSDIANAGHFSQCLHTCHQISYPWLMWAEIPAASDCSRQPAPPPHPPVLPLFWVGDKWKIWEFFYKGSYYLRNIFH